MDRDKVTRRELSTMDESFVIIDFLTQVTMVQENWTKKPETGTSMLYGKKGDGTMFFFNSKRGILMSFREKTTRKTLKRAGKQILL